ncbi:MAG: GntR family transcriptional regulator [Acuticoccus sp.]
MSRAAAEAAEVPALAALKTRALPEQIADRIVEGIATGVFAPGERLVEQTISDSLAVSRIPVREALRSLEAQGVVVALPRRGYRVALYDDKLFANVHAVRVSLELVAARAATANIKADAGQADGLEAIVAVMAERLANDDWSGPNAIDIAFHREMCRVADNPIVQTLWEAIARHIRIIFGLGIDVVTDPAFLYAEHRRMCDLLKTGDPAAVEEELRNHLRPASPRSGARARPAPDKAR